MDIEYRHQPSVPGVEQAGAGGRGAVLPIRGSAGGTPVSSLVAAVPALPGAAALSAGSLAAFVPPPGTARLLIAADRDAAGRRAAAGLEARAKAQGIAAVVLTPAHGDFNNDLAALGPRALAARLTPLLGHGP